MQRKYNEPNDGFEGALKAKYLPEGLEERFGEIEAAPRFDRRRKQYGRQEENEFYKCSIG